jgi:hypothetical protein
MKPLPSSRACRVSILSVKAQAYGPLYRLNTTPEAMQSPHFVNTFCRRLNTAFYILPPLRNQLTRVQHEHCVHNRDNISLRHSRFIFLYCQRCLLAFTCSASLTSQV